MPAHAEASSTFIPFIGSLLGERIRRFAGIHAGAALSGAGVGLGLTFGFSGTEDALAADGLPLVAVGILFGLWGARRSVEIEDRKEKHNALHAVLPASRRQLAAYQVIEPTLTMVLGAAAGFAAWWLLWRFGGTETFPAFDAGRPDFRADIRLIFGLGLWTLAVEIFQTAWNEVRSRIWGDFRGKIFFIGVPLLGGLAVGWIAGQLAEEKGLQRELFQTLFASPISLALAAALVVGSAWLAYHLFTRRPSYLDS